MQRRPSLVAAVLLSVVVAVVVAACGAATAMPSSTPVASDPPGSSASPPPASPAPAATPSSTPAASLPAGDVLVHVLLRGGHCRTGECRSEVTITAWGSVQRDDGSAVVVPQVLLIALVDAIRATDFDAILARPFTGECPTAYDGQEAVFTIATPDGPVEIASCSVEVNPNAPLFLALDRIAELAPYPSG